MLVMAPSAATWSRLRNSTSPSQPPLRTRAYPHGVTSADVRALDQLKQANRELEAMVWCAEQALFCRSSYVSLNIVFPDDLGSHSVTGPSSIWSILEFLQLEGVNDARRLAVYLSRLSGADHKRPITVLSTSRRFGEEFFQGWPDLSLSNENLSCRGPVLLMCECLRGHAVFHGLDKLGDVISSRHDSLGTRFWSVCKQASRVVGPTMPPRA